MALEEGERLLLEVEADLPELPEAELIARRLRATPVGVLVSRVPLA